MRKQIIAILVIAAASNSVTAQPIGWKAIGKGGAVASGKARSVAAGIEMLKKDGNAADAAAATLLSLAVTDYGLFAIGGEVPLLIYSAKTKKVKVLCGLGAAPLDKKAIETFYKNGIPSRGSMKAAPVPGAVDLCVTLLSKFGTMRFEQVVGPVLKNLDEHKKPWHKRLAVTLRKLVEAESQAKGSREQKLKAARDRFYIGDVADELEKWYIAAGAFLRKKDLAAHTTRIEDPVSVSYRGYQVHKCGPWTQGPYLCQTLRLLEGYDLRGMGHLSADYIHVVTESLKLGFADRDQFYGDPRFVKVPFDRLLSDRYTKLRRSLIDLKQASLEVRPGDPHKMRKLLLRGGEKPGPKSKDIPIQDTTTCVVADRWGNVVAATPSCNLVGNKPGPSGVTQGNRVRSLNTTLGHPNRVQPGKRPRITLTPTLVTKDGKAILAISVAGGDLQDQTTLNVLLNHVDFGMLPSQAVTRPRFNTSHHQNSFDPNPTRAATIGQKGGLRLNDSVKKKVREALAKRGHRISTTGGAIAMPVMIYIQPKTKRLFAAGDPRAGRHAAAID